MWTEFVFVGLFVLRCAVASSPPKPTNVSFSSVNLRNVLHWFPGNGTPDSTLFTVEYAIYGNTTEVSKGKRERWRAVHHCTNIVRTWCDLSAETWAEEEGYYARVRALGRKSSSKWTVTKKRFDPKWDTVFGPPLISVEMKNNSAIVTLRGPMRFSPNNHTQPLSMKELYPRMSYNLSVYNTHRNQMHHFPVETNLFKYQLLDYNTEYCFFAKSRFLSIPVQCKNSAWHCITTPQDPVIEQLQGVVVGIVVPSLCICIIVLISYLLYNYLNGDGHKRPSFLNRNDFFSSPLVILPDNVTLHPTTIIADKPSPCPEPPPSIPHPPRPRMSMGSMDNLPDDYGCIVRQPPKEEDVGEKNTRPEKHEKRDVNSTDDQSSGGYMPQTQRVGSSPTQTEVSALSHTFLCSQRNLVLPSQTDAQVQFNQRSVSDKQTIDSTIVVEEFVQKQNEFENVPLLSGYAPQSTPTMPNVHLQQSDCLPGDYGALFVAQAQQAETGTINDEIEMGAKCSNRNPESMQQVLPWMEITLKEEERLGGKREDKMTENFDWMYKTRGPPKLESVLLRQASDEEAGALIDEETGSEVDNVLRKWDLVFSKDD